MVNQIEKNTLRSLAKQYAEIAKDPVNTERRSRARDINDLKPRRPIVWLDEIPWHEMNIDNKLTLTCESEMARGMEWFFRMMLFRWEYIQADMVADNFFPIPKAYENTGMGIRINEHQIATDDRNYIVSHHYIDQLDTMDKVRALKEPVITALPEYDQQRKNFAEDILGDILPVKLQGHYIYHAPWDEIPRFRGVTPIMYDLMDNPELLHATMRTWTDYKFSAMRQMEAQGLLSNDTGSLHCTPPYTDDLPPGSGLKNIWFRCMAQMFSDVSPATWKEFELDYLMPLAKECGLVYYGCCEAIENKIGLLRTIPNLRKIGVPTRSNAESCAQQIKGDYVYAYKPNPAHVATTLNPSVVREEIARVIKTCKEHGCAYEFVLKDISTVGYDPQNLIGWVDTVMETIDGEY
ncbi:MAG: hypothetical protein FWC32_07060 [Firmicutes bacterium]|nr:hypothetical protein [Bacillota bacterium]